MSAVYLVTPFVAWFVAGSAKFLVNSIRARRFAFDLIGYGGFPSNHSAIVASMVVLIAVRDGIDTPAFGVAVALAFIVTLDAKSLRRHVGRHAAAINNLREGTEAPRLRERIGHSVAEIAGGLVLGGATGAGLGLLW